MDIRFRALLIFIAGLLTLGVWLFPSWYPLLERGESVQEFFPGMDFGVQEGFAQLPLTSSQREAFGELWEERPEAAEALIRAYLGEDVVVTDDPYPPEQLTNAQRIDSSVFNDVNPIQRADGTVEIYEFPQLTRVLVFRDFRSSLAPDAQVILTKDPFPLDQATVGTDYISLGQLRGNVGDQSYEIPLTVDLREYISVAIYSERYGLVIGVASFT